MDEDANTTREEERRREEPERRQSDQTGSRDRGAPASLPFGGNIRRVGWIGSALMVGVAVLVDGVQIPLDFLAISAVFTIPISVAAWLTFYLWFKMKGVSFGGLRLGQRGSASFVRNPLFIVAAALGVEMIPLVNAFPFWTAAIITALLVA